MIKGLETIIQGRIHPAGWPFIGLFLVVSLICLFLSTSLGCLAFLVTGWCIYFFRDPVRIPPLSSHVLVAPADGIVTSIGSASLPKELTGYTEGPCVRVSIFLNVFDVHVNRIPIAGRIMVRAYHPGQFLNASLDKASDLNERNTLLIETKSHGRIAVVQIAGLIARRIVCDVNLGDDVTLGQRFGMIRFGSRVDLYLPPHFTVSVLKGQRMIGGETVVACTDVKTSA